MDQSHSYHQTMLATSGSSALSALAWVWQQVASHGPGWPLVPPLLLACGSMYSAYLTGLKLRENLAEARERREIEARERRELHQVRVERMRAGMEPLPDMKALPPR